MSVRTFFSLSKKNKSGRTQKIMAQPIQIIFKHLQQKTRVTIWLYEQTELRIEGRIIGFDEFMNLTLDEAEEVQVQKGTRTSIGRILLKGDTITVSLLDAKILDIVDSSSSIVWHDVY